MHSKDIWLLYKKTIIVSIIAIYLLSIYKFEVSPSIWHMEKSSEDPSVQPSASNRTNGQGCILIYNRVPKAGSTTFLMYLNETGKKNKFSHVTSTNYHETNIDNAAQSKLVKGWLKSFHQNGTFSFDRHLHFINISSIKEVTFQEKQLFVWVNFVREPVERVISSFLFNRLPEVVAEQSLQGVFLISEEDRNKTLDECVSNKDPECLPPIGCKIDLQLSYFCGHDPRCSIAGDRWALQQAKYNVENYYSVVGTLEDYDLSFKVLESYMPRFFSGVNELSYGQLNQNKKRTPASDATLALMRDSFKLDIDFYDFVKQRLVIQAKQLNISYDTNYTDD